MAVTTKFIDLVELTRYDQKIKALISAEDAKAYKTFSWDANTNTLSGWKSESPQIGDTPDVTFTLADVAISGDADDLAYDNTTSGLTSTNTQDALDELAAASAGGVASKTVYITETAGQTADPYSKRYGIYQGATGSSSSPVVSEKLADIDIPKDMVVEDGVVVDVVFDPSDNTLHEGSISGTDVTAEIKGSDPATSADAGKYIKLTIANAASSHLWIKATDLVDIYTAQQDAAQIQLAIDANNVISATVVAGSIDTTELANSAVTTVKIADDAVTTAKILDDAVTADKVDIAAHTESHTAGADGIAVSVTTTDGQVSGVSASIAANTYDAYGAAAAAIADLDATPSQSAGADGLALSLTEVDGVVTAISGSIAANTYDAYGAAADAVAALDATESQTAGADGLALSITETDGVITSISGSIASGTYYDTATYGVATDSDIDALFPSASST